MARGKKNFNGFLRSKILEFIQIKTRLCSTYTSNNHLYGYNFFLFYSILLFHSTFPSSCCLFFFPLFNLILSSIFYPIPPYFVPFYNVFIFFLFPLFSSFFLLFPPFSSFFPIFIFILFFLCSPLFFFFFFFSPRINFSFGKCNIFIPALLRILQYDQYIGNT